MGTPQIILLSLMGIKLLLNAYMHGKPHETNQNFFVALVNDGILLWILIAGGFFK